MFTHIIFPIRNAGKKLRHFIELTPEETSGAVLLKLMSRSMEPLLLLTPRKCVPKPKVEKENQSWMASLLNPPLTLPQNKVKKTHSLQYIFIFYSNKLYFNLKAFSALNSSSFFWRDTFFLSISGDPEENSLMEWARPILFSSRLVPSF